ncbi:MAG: undecaprenyl-phosphate glucose phosphotransferase [Pseudomonadota bacterium]
MYQRGFFREHSLLLLWVSRLLDLCIFLAACLTAYVIVFGFIAIRADYEVAITIAVLVFLSVFQLAGLYRTWRGEEFTSELASMFVAWNIIFAILIFFAAITKTTADFSRAWLLMWYTGGFILLFLQRLTLRRFLRVMRRRGFNLRHVVVIGSSELGDQVLKRIRDSVDSGFNVCAYFTDDQVDHAEHVPIRGGLAEAPEFLQENQIDQIWIAMSLKQADAIENILDQLKDSMCDIRLIPDLFGFHLINHSMGTISGMPVINLSVTPMDGLNRWIKAMEDKVLSAIILVLASPIIALIAVLIKASGPGPIIYSQERLSWNGSRFMMYKFRTMPLDVEETSGPVWASKDEDRATAVGKFLRRTSLDELPQFWNVLKGDMSIVGPRPERPVFVQQFRDDVPSYMLKHMVKGGITGWAQINGWRGDTDIKKRIEYDLYYIDNWSLWLDLKIMLLTVFKGLVHKHAY